MKNWKASKLLDIFLYFVLGIEEFLLVCVQFV